MKISCTGEETINAICITTITIVIAVIIAIIYVFGLLLCNDPLGSKCYNFQERITGILFLLFIITIFCIVVPFFFPAGLLLFLLLIPVILYIIVK